MVISGVYVQVKNGFAAQVAKKLEKMTGVEVHRIEEGTKVIITIESPTAASSQDVCKEIQKTNHVLGVYPAYINFEGEEDEQSKGVEH